jgi:hypothetical protein
MTLKEKFLEMDIERYDLIDGSWASYMSEIEANQCVTIADDYAIEFAEWMAKEYWLNSSGKYLKYTRTSELLEIFKKEKGL